MRYNPFATETVAPPKEGPKPQQPKPPRPTSAEILVRINVERPDLVPSMVYDREWLWFCFDGKPSAEIREYLSGLKFRYTPASHSFDDGRVARWYYWSGKPPIRRRQTTQRFASSTASTLNNQPSKQKQIQQPAVAANDLDSFIFAMANQ